MADIKTTLCGIELKNPIIASSGTFGYGKEFTELYDINCLGAFSFKGTTLEARFGNDTPRIAECDAGMLISIGLQNPGAHAVAENELPRLKETYHGKLLANVCGFTPDEYENVIKIFDESDSSDIIGWYEVNISCPNVSEGGSCIGTSAALSENLVKKLRKVTKKPLIMKLTPNVTDVAEVARACEAGGADGVSLINTLYGMIIDLKRKKPVLANKMGGYCGTAAFPIALRMVYQVYEAVKIPIVGIGGISTPEHVLQMMMAGASAVEVGAANLNNPYVCPEIIDKLPEVMDKYGIKALGDIIGIAHS